MHDATDHELAFALSRLSDQDLTHTVTGIFRNVERATYDDAARAQVQQARDTQRRRGRTCRPCSTAATPGPSSADSGRRRSRVADRWAAIGYACPSTYLIEAAVGCAEDAATLRQQYAFAPTADPQPSPPAPSTGHLDGSGWTTSRELDQTVSPSEWVVHVYLRRTSRWRTCRRWVSERRGQAVRATT